MTKFKVVTDRGEWAALEAVGWKHCENQMVYWHGREAILVHLMKWEDKSESAQVLAEWARNFAAVLHHKESGSRAKLREIANALDRGVRIEALARKIVDQVHITGYPADTVVDGQLLVDLATELS